MKNPFLVLILVLFVGVNSIAQTTQPTFIPIAVSMTTVDMDDYEVSYPEDWSFDDSALSDTQFIISSPLTSYKDAFAEHVNYISKDISSLGLDLNQYIDQSVKQISTLIPYGKVLTNKRLTTSDGQAYHLLIYTGNQGVKKLKYLQHIYLKEQLVHTITFTAEKNKFDTYIRTAEKIMYTFNIK